MPAIDTRKRHSFEIPVKLTPGGDLWRHAPVKDPRGRSSCDLMMLLPGIKQQGMLPVIIRHQLQEVLIGFGDRVLFTDLNLRLGILWVTVTPEPGLCGEIADAIRGRINGARSVCHYIQRPQPTKLPWLTKVKRLIKLNKPEITEHN